MRLRIGIAIVLAFLIVVVLTDRIYVAIQSKHTDEEKAAIRAALDRTELAKVDRTDPFIWDEPYEIVFGRDKSNKRMIVWVGDKEVHAAYESEGITREQLSKRLRRDDPKRTLLRLTPGRWNGNYIWEAFYKKETDGQTRYYYDFYRFRDGRFLITYTLAKK